VKNKSPRVVLAIDPGYDRLGWAAGVCAGRKIELLEFGSITTNKKSSLALRYGQLQDELQKVLNKHSPQELAIETLIFSKNVTTALKVSESRGVCLACCVQAGLSIFEYNPMTIKSVAAGFGSADKKAVEKMIRLQFKLPPDLLDDTVDAIAILLTHSLA